MNDDIAANEDYRRVLATANKLETIQSNLESVIDLFVTPIIKLYSKLCNDCLKLFFECDFKLDHYRKAEELVWRRVYHDIYRFQKTKKPRIKRHDEFLMESHFITGIGFYSSLIVRLRTHYKIDEAKGVTEPLNWSLGPLDNFSGVQRLNEEDETVDNSSSTNLDAVEVQSLAKDWARQAIYRSLVYMGDLARYLLETSPYDYRKLAFEFYKSASRYQPDYGLPYNQLATLAGGLNYNLGAVCNYMRCCLRPKPFEGAEGNMRKIFEFNKKHYEEIKKKDYVFKVADVLSSKEPNKAAESMMRAIIITFIKLTSDLWSSISENNNATLKIEIIDETKLFFECLREALELEPIEPLVTANRQQQEFCPISGSSYSSEKPKLVSSTIMYEFCSVSIMLIAKSQSRRIAKECASACQDDRVVDLVNTLALNLLHYSTSKCQKMILSKVQELRVSQQDALSVDRNALNRLKSDCDHQVSVGNRHNSSNRSVDFLDSLADSTSKRTQSRIRKRKAATNYSNSVIRDRPLELRIEDSDMSELEETALSTIDALDISSDMSEDADYQINDLIDLGSSSDEGPFPFKDGFPPKASGFRKFSKPLLRPTRSQNYELRSSISIAKNPSNSLPVPDLLTGDMSENFLMGISATSHSSLESNSESEVKVRSSTLNTAYELGSAWAFVYKQTYLPTIKIFCDWLLSDGEIINSNLQSFRPFCNELDDLLSILGDLKRIVDLRNASDSSSSIELESDANAFSNRRYDPHSLYRHVYDGPSWVQKYPLSCDFPLLNLDPLKSVHKLNIDFDYHEEIDESEAGFITMQCIVAFYHALSAFLENKNSS